MRRGTVQLDRHGITEGTHSDLERDYTALEEAVAAGRSVAKTGI